MSTDKIIWLTDIHLNFLKAAERVQFYNRVVEIDADKLLITGDIAEAKDVKDFKRLRGQKTYKRLRGQVYL